jgi:imidazolonepropionase
MIIGHDGKIVAVDTEQNIEQQFGHCTYTHFIDATEYCILPGLVDGHTHPVWAGDRVHEFAMKLAGATYMDIHKVTNKNMF